MRVDLMPGAVVVVFSRQFGQNEARRVAETLASFAPLAEVTLDFTATRDLDEAAFGPLSEALEALPNPHVILRGLTRRQVRMLEYLGVRHLPPEAVRPERAAGGRGAD